MAECPQDTRVRSLLWVTRTDMPPSADNAAAALREIGREISFARDDVLRRPGEACDRVAIVTDGQIRVETLSDNGRAIELYRIRPGDPCVLEVSAALSGATYPAHAIAQTDGQAIAVATPRLIAALADDAAIRERIFSTMSWRLHDVMALASEVAFHRIDQRLARLLLRDCDDAGRVAATHEELASRLGTAREVVSRLVARFAEEGLVSSERGLITVLDRDLLEQRDHGH